MRLVSLAQLVQGAFEVWIALQLLLGLAAGKGPGVHSLLLVVTAVIGPLRVISGLLNRSWRGRWLSIVVSAVGVVTIPTFCIPTSVAVLLFVVVAQLDRQVREAFRMRATGASEREASAWLHRPVDPRRAS